MEHAGATDLPLWRRRLGRAGVWVFGGAVDEDLGGFARVVERLGYGALWIGGGKTAAADFSRLEALLAATDELVVATGITKIWAWEPRELAAHAARLAAAYPDRVVLGLGVSHAPLVEQMGQRYERPYRAMVAFLDALADLAEPGPPCVLAALGPRMLRLSATRSAGAHPYLTTPGHTRVARETLGPKALLAPEQALVLEEDPDVARRRARAYLERYLRLPNYVGNLRRFGWRDEDVQDGGSDALVDALVVHGSVARVGSGVLAHLDAGADHVCVQPLGEGGSVDRHALEALAPVLVGDPGGRRGREKS